MTAPTIPSASPASLPAIAASGDRTAALRSVSVPTLVLHGADDPLVNVSGGRATARAIPGAELVVFEGMGHHLSRELWGEIARHIGELVERAEAGRADHTAVTRPPLGLTVAPTKNAASSETRNATVAAISSGVPSRPIGVRATFTSRATPTSALVRVVSMNPGATALTLIPWTITSFAVALVKPRTPALAAE